MGDSEVMVTFVVLDDKDPVGNAAEGLKLLNFPEGGGV